LNDIRVFECHMHSTALSVRPVAQLFKALGDDARLRIVALLSHGELCVCHLQEALRLTQPTASRHLAVLRSAGVVEASRKGSWVYYRLADQEDDARKRQLRAVVREFARQNTLREDVERLVRVRGPGACQ
jgi:ArsR family transcriptional regulator